MPHFTSSYTPLQYLGQRESNPPGVWERPRSPTTSDSSQIYSLGDIWVDTVANNIYILSDVTNNVATWVLAAVVGGALNTLTGDVGGAIAPAAGNINIQGGAAGAISFSNGGAGQMDAAVQVDGVTISIVANELVAASSGNVNVDGFAGPGTDPVVPDGTGQITVTGGQVAAGTVGANVIRTFSAAANTYTVQIQRSAAVAGSASANNGVCHFDSAAFAVDANGFVTLAGGGLAIDQVAVQAATGPGTNPVLPTGAGQITINGAAVAAQSIPLRSHSIAANTLQLEVQRAATSTGTDATSQGVASFSDTQFTVDANGYVELLGGATGTAQTVGAVTADVITFPMGAVAGTRAFDVTVAGFEATGPSGCGYSIIASVRTTGAAATSVPTPDITVNEDAALAAASATVVVAGNNAIVRVTGVAGLTIEWSATLQSVFAS